MTTPPYAFVGHIDLLLTAFLPWAVLWLLSSMHAAPVFTTHALWQIFVVAGLLISVVTCIIRKR